MPAPQTDDSIEARAQRAEDQGFHPQTWYHATSHDFNEFHSNDWQNATGEKAHFFTSDPVVADSYHGGQYVRSDSPSLKDYGHAPMEGGVSRVYSPGSQVYPVKIRDLDKFVNWDYGGGPYDARRARSILKEAKKNKAPGVLFTNIRDPGMYPSGPLGYANKNMHVVAVFDNHADKIRSVNAKFNPKDKKSRNILAADGGSISTPIGNTGISVDPSKAARTALLVAKGIGRKPFGNGGSSGYEEWQAQPNGAIADQSNAVTGPVMPDSGQLDPSDQLHNWRQKQELINMMGGQEVRRGGRINRDAGGNAGLKNAINSFSQQRNAQLTGSPESAQQEQMMLAALMNQPRELAVAEPPQQARQPVANQYGDLGDEIERGAKFLEGEPADDDNAPVAGQPTKGAVVNAATGTNSLIDRTKYGIAGVESAGQKNPYLALGPVTRNGDRAYGKYQVMGSNVPAWTKEALGKSLTPEQFLNDPNAQEQTVGHQLGKILSANGNDPHQAASVWFTGRRLENVNPQANDGYTTNSEYQRRFSNAFNAYPKVANQTVQSADISDYAPPLMEGPDSQGIIKDPNSDGSFTLRDANGNTVGYDRGAASLSSVPYSQPHIASPNSGPPLPPPRPPDSSSQGEGASAGPQAQADPMSNTYDNPLDPNAAPAAARGGKIKRRADGGPAYNSMPTNELIDRALRIIRKHRDSGGGIPAPKSIAQIQQQMQNADTRLAAASLGADLQNQMSSGIHYAGGESPEAAQFGLYRDQVGFLGAPSSPSTPTSQPTPDNTPAVKSGTVGNQGIPTGAGINDAPTSGPPSYDPASSSATGPTSPIPMASPTGFNGSNYNNTIDQALGTNNPTMNQIFGFNYPQNLPLPKPQPQGPVSQNEINALYGFGGGSQMGTGTGMFGFNGGGAIIMDALNRARKAKGGSTLSPKDMAAILQNLPNSTGGHPGYYNDGDKSYSDYVPIQSDSRLSGYDKYFNSPPKPDDNMSIYDSDYHNNPVFNEWAIRRGGKVKGKR